MKQNKFFSLLAAGMLFGFAACNNSSDTAATSDSLNNAAGDTSNMANAGTSSSDYSAYADNIEKTSQEGHYRNPKTGKPLKLKVDRTSGVITDTETGEPVWRYVDDRNWWVYGLDDDYYWDKIGEAKMQSDKLVYKDSSDKWVNYDVMWKSEDENLSKTWKTKSGDMKIKFGKDGDIKIKDKDGTVKYDADDNKVKTDSSHK